MEDDNPLLFDVATPLGFNVRCTENYWERLTTKHPPIAERLEDVKQTLTDPDEVHQSRRDENVLLFYRADEKRWVCAVTRRLNGDGFLITVYPTDAIKKGKLVWKRDNR